jgi:hypothetical protein
MFYHQNNDPVVMINSTDSKKDKQIIELYLKIQQRMGLRADRLPQTRL